MGPDANMRVSCSVPCVRPDRTAFKPGCPGWGEGRMGPDANMRVSCSVPCVRPDRTCSVFSTKLPIVVHNFAR